MVEEHVAPASPKPPMTPPSPIPAVIHHEDVHDLVYDMFIYFFGNIGYFVLVALRVGIMIVLFRAADRRYQEIMIDSYWVDQPDLYALVYWTHVIEALSLLAYNYMERRLPIPMSKEGRKTRLVVYLLSLVPHLTGALMYAVISSYNFIVGYSSVAFMFSLLHIIVLAFNSGIVFCEWWNTPSVKVHRVRMMNAIHLLCEMGTDLGHFIFEHYF